jgi:hypothetical protein
MRFSFYFELQTDALYKEEETLQANKGLEGRQTRLELKTLNHRGRQLTQKTQSSSPGAAIKKSGRMCSLQSFCKSQAMRDAAPHLTGEVTGGIANHEYEFST